MYPNVHTQIYRAPSCTPGSPGMHWESLITNNASSQKWNMWMMWRNHAKLRKNMLKRVEVCWNMLSCWQGAWWGQQVLAHQPSVPAHALVAHEAYYAHCSFGEVPYGGACHAISAILESDKKYETRSVWDFTFFLPGLPEGLPYLSLCWAED